MSGEQLVRNVTWTDPALVQGITCHGQPPRHRSATGYGRKIPTGFMIRYANRWRRVYMMQYGNAGTAYIVAGGADLVLESATEYRVECASRGVEPSQDVLDTIAKFSTL